MYNKGADVNFKDNYGRTALHWVVFWNKPNTIKNLIRLGANPHIMDAEGNTPIDIAVARGYNDLQKLMI